MKILYITDVFPPKCGGSGWSVYFFARGLRERGHEVDILALDGNTRQYDGFQVDVLPLARSDLPFLGNWRREHRDLPRAAEIVRGHAGNYDLAHAHHKLSALALSLASPPRWFVTIRDYWPICICGRSMYRTAPLCTRSNFTSCSRNDGFWKGVAAPLAYSWFEARMRERLERLQRAERILCISHYVREQLVPFFAPDKLEVLPNFAEEILAATAEPLPDRFALYVGRLEENKGPQFLPEILKLAGTKIPLMILGEGSLRALLEREFQARGIDARFLGYREFPEMLSILARCEFVLFPSRWAEPLGRVLIESAMMGKPAVAFSHPGGHRDIVDHDVTGLLAGTPEDFAAALKQLEQDAALRERLGREARARYSRRFSPESVLPRLISLYQA